MKTWKEIPSWFKLEHYKGLVNGTARDWLIEIDTRANHRYVLDLYAGNLVDPSGYQPEEVRIEAALNFFNSIKREPLISQKEKEKENVQSELDKIFRDLEIERKHEYKFATIHELSEYSAYTFLLEEDLEKKKEIENDISLFSISQNYDDFKREIKKSIDIKRKYSQPIANKERYGDIKFLEIDLCASNEQILKEFNHWLIDTRNSNEEFIKNQFSNRDFQDWYESQLLPYWDLTTIALFENATIPNHVIGAILFPNEYGIDLTERVRKVTRKKCQFIFSKKVSTALLSQANSEKLKRNEI